MIHDFPSTLLAALALSFVFLFVCFCFCLSLFSILSALFVLAFVMHFSAMGIKRSIDGLVFSWKDWN